MIWWSKPSPIPVDYTGPIQIFTIDADTHVPVQADLAFEGQSFYATVPPTGRPTSYYIFKWPRQLVPVPNAEGDTDLVPPMMTISAAGYEPVKVPGPTVVAKMVVLFKREGKTITVIATDSLTSKPVEAQISLATTRSGSRIRRSRCRRRRRGRSRFGRRMIGMRILL